MPTSTVRMELTGAMDITVTEDALTADLKDGRTITVPLLWHPRLVHATADERNNWELHAEGQHIHWPDLDEDISIEGMLAGWPSRESQKSLQWWLDARKEGRSVAFYDLFAYEKERQQAKETP